jgi:cysteine synthase
MNSPNGQFGLNVFEGSTAIRDFLNPDNSPPVPLVELPGEFNPCRAEGVRIFAKLMYLLPLLNIKSLPMLNMLIEAKDSGKLDGVHTLVENSSGNAAFSLAVLATLFGVPRTIAILPWDIAPGKLEILRVAGVESMLKREDPLGVSGIAEARMMGERPGFFNAGQYGNEANPAAYEKWVAPQIWNQTKGKVNVLAAGLGTTGTLVGASRYFKRNKKNVSLVGGICRPGEAVPGVRSLARLREIEFDWKGAADAIVEVGTVESYKKSMQLCRAGIVAGPSSGFALVALQRFLEEKKADSTLDQLRNADDEVVAVFICSDTPFAYLDKYSTHLDSSDF